LYVINYIIYNQYNIKYIPANTMLHVTYMLIVTNLHNVCYVTVTLLSRKLQLTYTLHVTTCLLGYFATDVIM